MLKRGRPPKPGTLYFPEKDMVELLKEYQQTKSEEVFNKMMPKLTAIINGMINNSFSYNTYIKKNIDDARSECVYEIITSYKRYDPERGRLYAYTNRIVKNTLLKYSKKIENMQNKESTYTDINSRISEMSQTNYNAEENIFNLCTNYADDETMIENIFNNISNNKRVDISSSIYIIYNYVNHVNDIIKFFIHNPDEYSKVLENISYDTTVEFNMFEYYEYTILTKKEFYFNLLDNLYFVTQTLKNWINDNFEIKNISEPENYTGIISDRMLCYIRKYVVDNFKDNILNDNMNREDIIKFMNYVISSYRKIHY